MIYFLINQFSDNQDSSEVSYKKFIETHDDIIKYPTFSICTPGAHGGIFYPLRNNSIYDVLYNHSEHYTDHYNQCNKSKVQHPWCEIKLYQKMLLGEEEPISEISEQNVEEITRNILEKVKRYQFKLSARQIKHQANKTAMYLSYQDSLRVCITKIPEPGMGRNHSYDLYGLNAKSLNLPIEVYIHQIGSLIDQLGKKRALLITNTEIRELHDNFKETKLNSSNNRGITVFHDLHIRRIEILRKRSNAVKSCNESIYNNDELYKREVVKEVGCIPSYWKRFFENENSPNCTTKAQFDRLTNMLPMMFENTNLLNGSKLYVQPCNEMKILTSINKRNERLFDNRLWLGFYYDSDEYIEIQNNEAYTSYDLWSQIGGIVGIFLGYSILQVNYSIYHSFSCSLQCFYNKFKRKTL